MTEPIEPIVQTLHQNCVKSLKAYIKQANLTCTLLNDIVEFPIPSARRIEIVEQRQRENAAQAEYQQARTRLFEAAKWE